MLDLNQFTGTEQYHNVMGVKVTDGVAYIMQNGYSWLVTDALAVLRIEIKNEPFVAVKLKVNKDKTAQVSYEDGDGKRLYQQKYKYTDAEQDITLYFIENVLLLSSEY